MSEKVFVYGTLRQGGYNHYLLKDSNFLGTAETKEKFTMKSLGGCPAVMLSPSVPIIGEVYEVDDVTFRILDGLEGYPDFYNREKIDTPYGTAWMYYIEKDYNYPVIPSGDWNEHTKVLSL